MEAINRAIEDASDFQHMLKQLTQTRDDVVRRAEALIADHKAQASKTAPKRPGENRAQYRARIFGRKVSA